METWEATYDSALARRWDGDGFPRYPTGKKPLCDVTNQVHSSGSWGSRLCQGRRGPRVTWEESELRVP